MLWVTAGLASAGGDTWDTSSTLPLLLADTTNTYIYGPGNTPLEQINSSGTITWYAHDQLDNTRLLTDTTATIVAAYGYDPYGNLTHSRGPADTPLQYNGQYHDTETGNTYLRARYYDPTTAQFITKDPLIAVTRAPYSYAGSDPLNSSDPTGLMCWSPHCLLHTVATVSAVVQTAADIVAAGAALFPGGQAISAAALSVSEVAGIVSAGATCADAVLGVANHTKNAATFGDCAAGVAINVATAGIGNFVAPGRIGRGGKFVLDWEEKAARGTINAIGDGVGWLMGWKPPSDGAACGPTVIGPAN